VVYFEMPNALWTLRDMGIWDIIYEHCSYFTPASLAAACEGAGFSVLDLREVFGGQFLAVEAVPADGPVPPTFGDRLDFVQMERDVAAFGENYRAKVDHWRTRLDELAHKGQRAVVWGSGSKGVTFLNTLRDESPIAHVVDINPRKQGMFVAGTGQAIISPDALREHRPDLVIVMNRLYEGEIRRMLDERGIDAPIECA
jgi:hypothetical protein